MKRVLVRYLDDKGNLSISATDAMPDAEAEEPRHRIEQEHAAAGSENRWIRVGQHSVQSRQIQAIHLEEPIERITGSWGDSDYA